MRFKEILRDLLEKFRELKKENDENEEAFQLAQKRILERTRLHCRWAFMILTVPGFFKPVILV